MSVFTLAGSVGVKVSGVRNFETDVKKIQVALNNVFKNDVLIAPLNVNGIIGDKSSCKTLARIAYFQKKYCSIKNPDMVISVNGLTHRRIQELSNYKDQISSKLPPLISNSPTVIVWPLKKNYIREGMVNHTFGLVRRNRDGSPRPHQGWDLHAYPGTPIYAISYGVVEFVRNWQDYGLQVCISFTYLQKKYYAFYAHLKSVNVRAGDSVSVGEHIGHSGVSGNAGRMQDKEQHLHFEIRTVANPGRGLVGRISPMRIYGICPLQTPILQREDQCHSIIRNAPILQNKW